MMPNRRKLALSFFVKCLLCAFAGLLMSDAVAFAQNPRAEKNQKKVDFVRDIEPLMKEKCHSCHGPDEQEGSLRLDAKSLVFKGGVSGKLIVKGNGAESLLYRRLKKSEILEQMPLDDDPFSQDQMELIRRWIDQGAVWPDGVGAQATELKKHWAYIKPVRSAPPKVKNRAWPINALDYFVLSRLEKEGLAPSPPAEKAKLLRRVYLDVIGLPPSVEEIDAFLSDKSPQAYERVVDRLLALKSFGERWARPWLDAARYADSNGYQADQYRSVWPYRDWVVRAMNDDMPFDQFTIEQLAGDLLPSATLDQKIATGFHRLTTCNVEAGVDPEENRTNQLIDRVNTTGTVWLGTSIGCGQCHNHKYDPFTQADYYSLYAYFNNTPLEVEGNGVTYDFTGPKMDLPLEAKQIKQREVLQKQHDLLNTKLARISAEKAKRQPQWEKELAKVLKTASQRHVLEPVFFTSSGGASYEVLEDHSILLSGEKPDNDTYTLIVHTDLQAITGFKIDALTDPSLPGTGPGRQNPQRPNFVLNEFHVFASQQDTSQEGAGEQKLKIDAASPVSMNAVSLHAATADFANKGYPAAAAIDGDPKTGWAIHSQFGKPHHAEFLTIRPVGFEDGTTLKFTFAQNHGGGKTIGRLRVSAITGSPKQAASPENIAKILEITAEKRTPKQKKNLSDYFLKLDPAVKKLQQEIAAVKKQLDAIQPITTLVMIEQDKPRENYIFIRGNFLNKGKSVIPGVPASLHSLPEDAAPNRLSLARWLVGPENPLTPRVMVNRWWAEIFGQGIVATLEDFGTRGDAPTHPQVLDTLSREFIESGWSMKHVIKTIVMSATYRQSSRISSELLQRDPYNKLLARGPRFRLAGETVRDNALVISGLISKKIGGPPVYPPQPEGIWRHVGRNAPKYTTSQGSDRFRRGLYVYWRRSAPYPSLTNFDAPDRASCVVKRPRTNTPLQALTLMNDPAYVEMTLALARRIASDHTEMTINQKIQYGFRLCVARKPKASEAAHLEKVYQRELARFQADPKAAKKIIGKSASDANREELAAWFYIANILFNLDETISKG